jgi:protein AroM
MGKTRLAFVTIGQSPRDDIVPEMLADIGGDVEAGEFGALDGMAPAEIEALHPAAGEACFATRLRDGRGVTVSKALIESRLEGLLGDLDRSGFEAIVLLCTGTEVKPLRRTLLIEAQRIVDATVAAMAASARRLGIMLPLKRQLAEFPTRRGIAESTVLAAASPYAGDDIAAEAQALAGCDLVVMHCMGYSEAMRAAVRQAIPAPVLLSRRIVSGAVRQIL